jgi:arginase
VSRPVQLIIVPYDSGRMGERFGRGPLHALDMHRASPFPHAGGQQPQIVTHGGDFATEASAAFEIARRIAVTVRHALETGAFPLVIAGNCMTSLGAVSALPGERSVLWLDAHPDYNTPDTTTSGFLDGMGAAILVGDAWPAAAASVSGYRPLDKARLAFVGIRDIDPAEAERLAQDGIAIVAPNDAKPREAALLDALRQIGDGADSGYLHFDMDVLDPDPTPINEYSAPGGVKLAAALDLIRALPERFPLQAAAVTAWDPGLDTGGSVVRAYKQVIAALCETGATI